MENKALLGEIQKIERASRFTLPVLAVALAAILISLYVSAVSLSRIQGKLDAANSELNARNGELERLEKALADSRDKLERTRREVENTDAQNAALKSENQSLVEEQIRIEKANSQSKVELTKQNPSSVNIVLARESQRAKAEQIKGYFEAQGVPVRIILQKAGMPIPYATEVRYFRYPEDLPIAQKVLQVLQNDFKVILSRVSLVRDPDQREPRAIDIYFNNDDGK